MDNNLDELEEKLKEQEKPKKKHIVSGRSVFELQKIIKEKSNNVDGNSGEKERNERKEDE